MLERCKSSPRRIVDFCVMIRDLSFSVSLESRGRLDESWMRPSMSPQSIKASSSIAMYRYVNFTFKSGERDGVVNRVNKKMDI